MDSAGDDEVPDDPTTVIGVDVRRYDDLEVVERGAPGRGFDADDDLGQDSYAMEDGADEARLDPRLNQKAEPATELIDRDALAALSAAEDDELVTLGAISLPEITPYVPPQLEPRVTADAATTAIDPAERATLVPSLQGGPSDVRSVALPADTMAIQVPASPEPPPGHRAPSSPPHPSRGRPVEDDTTGALLDRTDTHFGAGAEPQEEVSDGQTRFLPVARPHAHDPCTEVIVRSDPSFHNLPEETVPTSLPTLEEIERLAFEPLRPVDEGHDELALPPPLGGDPPPERSNTHDALSLPPPEPGEASAPISLQPIPQGSLLEHTLPIHAAAPDSRAVSAPPLPSWAARQSEPVTTPRPAPSPGRSVPPSAPPAPTVPVPQRSVPYAGAPGPEAPGPAAEASPPGAAGVPPMVGMLALIGSGGVLAAVVAVSVFVLGGLAILVAWDSGPSEPVEPPLPPIELPEPQAPESPAIPPPEPQAETPPAPEPPRSGPRRPPRPPPAPEPVPEPAPVPIAPPPPVPAGPPAPLPDLEPEPDDDDRRRGLFRRRK